MAANIEIKTVQNVTIRYELGSFWERMFATLIDWILLTGVFILLSLILGIFNIGQNGVFTLFYVVFVFYTPVSEYLLQGGSLGKRAMGLRILRLDGQPVEVTDYIIRWAFRLVDLYLSAGSLASILVGFTQNRQRIGDLLSNTVVVKYYKKEGSIEKLLSIRSMANYQPSFAQAHLLNESEAMLIKETLDRYKKYQTKGHLQAIRDLSQAVSRKLDIRSTDVVNDSEFLLAVLRDYVALSR